MNDIEWRNRFVEYMVEYILSLNPSVEEIREYATSIVDSYLLERNEFQSPEEAVETDVSNWE